MKHKNVVIGLPVYNGEKFIKHAIDSILSQSYKNFELIISDNCSEDNTKNICKEYVSKDKRVSYIRHIKNFGAHYNFKFLLDRAKRKYFMWAAADDIWLPNFLNSCVKSLDNDKKANYAMTDFIVVSRFSSIFNIEFTNGISFIENKDREQRLLAYSKKKFNTHIDNLFYSVWRREFLQKILVELGDIYFSKYPSVHVVQSALYKSHGKFIPYKFFLKTYSKIPPGHFLNKINKIKRYFFKKKQTYSVLIKNSKITLQKSGVEKKTILKFISNMKKIQIPK